MATDRTSAFKSLRWRLTFWFVTLTTAVYVLSAMFATYLFRDALTNVVEDEMEALMSEIEPAIKLRGDTPTLQEWARTSLVMPFKFLPTIQLYDKNSRMVEHYGPQGLPDLYTSGGERTAPGNHLVRVFSSPLDAEGKLVGYLQIQVNLRSRERAVKTFIDTLCYVAPYLLLCMGVAGYMFSAFAAKPVEESFHVLRRFMTDAGHELGTPISIIQANAELLEPDVQSNEGMSNRLAVITRSTDRLGSLVHDLILLSKMESPELQKKRQVIDFDKLVRGAVEEFEALFSGKNIELTADKIVPSQVLGDPDSLKRLLMNLLQNALRYTEAGGTVTVGLDHVGRSTRLTVSDTGIGIPEESLPRIFDRFYRVEKSRTRAAGGAGLGLSIVKAIVDLHRGRIEVTSKVGTGTTFTAWLPLRG
ncbi:MAG TPA: HAMP domain-containing sensor histidine kinase [Trichormus sp.]